MRFVYLCAVLSRCGLSTYVQFSSGPVAIAAGLLRRQMLNSPASLTLPTSLSHLTSGRPRHHLPSGDQAVIRMGFGL